MRTMQQPHLGTQKTHLKNSKPVLRRLVLALVLLFFIGAALFVAYIWISGGSGTPSGAASVAPLEVKKGDTRTLFKITSPDAEARFITTEELLGQPKTVVGSTHEVAGEMLVDFNNIATTQLGTIRINVRTLETDNEFRTRALRGQILQAEQPEFEFAEFVPTSLLDLPTQVSFGTAFDFQITGNLTVHGITKDVTFSATVTPIGKDRIEGTARATVLYKDFGMSIPSAAGVANVSDNIQLEIDFIAHAAG